MGFGSSVYGLTVTGALLNAASSPKFRAELDAGFANPLCVHGNYLFGFSQLARVTGIPYYDGKVTKPGGKLLGSSVAQDSRNMWSDGTRLYALGNSLARYTIPYSVAPTGALVCGETLTQATSGATGYFIRDTGTGIIVAPINGTTFTTGNTITGGTSTFTVAQDGAQVSVSNYLWLMRSETGLTDFYPVLDLFMNTEVGYGMGLKDFCNCGDIGGKQLLLFTEYNTTNIATPIWYCYPADGKGWTPLLTFDANSIDHIHSITCVRDVGGVSGAHKLLICTGDSVNTAGILICDDIADLIANPSTWKTRWGGDKTGTTRRDYLTTGEGKPYCWGMMSQNNGYKCVDLIADSTNNYVYSIPDNPGLGININLKRFRLSDGAITTGSTISKGPGAYGIQLSDGTILFSAFSECGAIGGGNYGPLGGSDADIHIYAINQNSCDLVEIYSTPRLAATDVTSLRGIYPLMEFPSGMATKHSIPVWFGGGGGASYSSTAIQPVSGWIDMPDKIGGMATASTRSIKPADVYYNYMQDSRFNASSPAWTVTTNCTLGRESSIVDTANNELYSLKLTPAAGVSVASSLLTICSTSSRIPLCRALRGQWITIDGRFLADVGSQAAYIMVYCDDPLYSIRYDITASASWQQFSLPYWVIPTANNVMLQVFPRSTGSATADMYLSDVIITTGARPFQVPRKLPGIDAFGLT